MQNSIEVSVICPLYNMEEFLGSFIKSYQRQKNIKKELIIVDDASSDNSLAVAKVYAETDSSIKVIALKENKGSGNARNVGLDESTGEFVMFADPDDELAYSFSLCHLYKAAKKYQQNIAIGNVLISFINDNLKVLSWVHDYFDKTKVVSWKSLKNIDMWQCLIKKSFLTTNNIRFSDGRRSQDSIFIWNIQLKSDEVLCVNHYIYQYTILYRFINLTSSICASVLKASNDFLEKAKVLNTKKLSFDEFFSEDDNAFPRVLSWMTPQGYLDKDSLSSNYAITQEEANWFLEEFNKLKIKYKDIYLDSLQDNTSNLINNEKLVYKINKKANLIFIKYAGTDTFVPSQNTKNYLKTIKNIHLCSYTNNFSYVVDTFNQETDLIIFVRTADVLPLQHLYPSPKRKNVIDDVNLLGLGLIIGECKNLETIYLHSLYPAATYILLNNRKELIDKCILSLYAINVNLEKFDARVIKVLSQIKQTYYSLQSDYELLKDYLNSSVFIKKPCYFTKKNLLSEYMFNVPWGILVLSNSYTIALDTLPKYQTDNITCVFFDLLPFTKKKLIEKTKNLQIYFIEGYAFYHSTKDYLSKATKVVYNVDNFFDIELIVLCIVNKIEIVSDLPRNQQLIQEIKRIMYNGMKISIFGAGYVGFSLAVLLARKYEVFLFDINKEKLKLIENKVSPLKEKDIVETLAHDNLNLKVAYDVKDAIVDADIAIVCTPTNFDSKTNSFNTESIVDVLNWILKYKNKDTQVVIKSTVPIGFTENLAKEKNIDFLHFSPEFLREGHSIKDNLYPSRIIVGSSNLYFAEKFADILKSVALKENVFCLCTQPTQAEAIKLFSNTYLAMRVAFFNELDSFAMVNNLDAKAIIDGVCADERIGFSYNNPSFGYGGYCLPKDTKQLETNYKSIPHSIVKATIEANTIRKELIVSEILKRKVKVVGVYRLVMKAGSDNFRESSIIDILKGLQSHNIKVVLYEPYLQEDEFLGVKVIRNLDDFIKSSEIVVANRITAELLKYDIEIFSRDIYHFG